MNEIVKEQILAVRNTGKTNMLDVHAVQRIAFDMGLYHLVDYIEENQTRYVAFIFTGTTKL